MPKKKQSKSGEKLSPQDKERLELLQKAHEKKGQQLRIDGLTGNLSEINEIRELIGKQVEDPQEKYNMYYHGISNLLKKYLPPGKNYEAARRLIYDEKNVFLNRGKRKSDNNGIRGSDGRMTYQPVMAEILDIVASWVSESQNPVDIYDRLYDLNEKHGYGHEIYDDTTSKVQIEIKRGRKV